MSSDPYESVDLWEGARVLVTSTVPGSAAPGDLGTVVALEVGDAGDVQAAMVQLEGADEAMTILKDADDDTIPLAAAYTASTLQKALGLHYDRVRFCFGCNPRLRYRV